MRHGLPAGAEKKGGELLRHVLAWFVMLGVAMVNGGLRDLTYGRYLPELAANQISCASAIVLLGLVIYGYVRRWPLRSAHRAFAVGFLWLALTIAFEFLFFHYVAGHPLDELLADYDVRAGRLWPVVLLWIWLAPWMFHRFLRNRPGRNGMRERD